MMDEREDPVLPPGTAAESDPVARLVRLAGARSPVPPERAGRVEAAVREAWLEAVATRRRRRWTVSTAAAALAAALALALGLAFWPRTPQPAVLVAEVERVTGGARQVSAAGAAAAGQPLAPGQHLAAGSAVTTGDDGRVAVRLAGGPSLRLDVGSRLELAASDRVVLRSGAVYVDSQGGAPIAVETPLGVVEEIGTQFEVRLAGEAVRVRVREGAVSLEGEGRRWDATAGAELTLDHAGRLARRRVPAHGEAWSWVQEIAPTFHIEGRSLREFLAWVGRETGWPVRWRDGGAERAGSVTLHGPLPEGLPPEQALAAVLPTCGLTHSLEDGTILVFAATRD